MDTTQAVIFHKEVDSWRSLVNEALKDEQGLKKFQFDRVRPYFSSLHSEEDKKFIFDRARHLLLADPMREHIEAARRCTHTTVQNLFRFAMVFYVTNIDQEITRNIKRIRAPISKTEAAAAPLEGGVHAVSMPSTQAVSAQPTLEVPEIVQCWLKFIRVIDAMKVEPTKVEGTYYLRITQESCNTIISSLKDINAIGDFRRMEGYVSAMLTDRILYRYIEDVKFLKSQNGNKETLDHIQRHASNLFLATLSTYINYVGKQISDLTQCTLT